MVPGGNALLVNKRNKHVHGQSPEVKLTEIRHFHSISLQVRYVYSGSITYDVLVKGHGR